MARGSVTVAVIVTPKKRDAPHEEADLVALALALLLEFKVVHCPSALSFGQIADKLVVVGRVRRLLDNDLGFLVVNAIDDVLGLLAQLERLEFLKALGADSDTGGL